MERRSLPVPNPPDAVWEYHADVNRITDGDTVVRIAGFWADATVRQPQDAHGDTLCPRVRYALNAGDVLYMAHDIDGGVAVLQYGENPEAVLILDLPLRIADVLSWVEQCRTHERPPQAATDEYATWSEWKYPQ